MYKKRLEQNIEFEKINEENFLKFNVECFKEVSEKTDIFFDIYIVLLMLSWCMNYKNNEIQNQNFNN